MTFRITISTGVNEFDAFYQDEGWEDFCSKDEDLKELYEKCCEVCPRDTDAIWLLKQKIEELDIAEGYSGYVQDPISAKIEVDYHPDGDFRLSSRESRSIENPFSDYEKHECPEPEDVLECIQTSKFCYLKVWENSGEWHFDGDGECDISKLTYEKGKFLYDSKEFEFIGGDGSGSYIAFYRDGEDCYG